MEHGNEIGQLKWYRLEWLIQSPASFCVSLLLRTYASERLQRLYQDYLRIPVEHQRMLPSIPATIDRIQKAIDKNYEFVRAIVSTAVGMFEDSEVSQFVSVAVFF